MMDLFIIIKLSIAILSCTIFFCLYRAILGPTTADRIIGINVVGTKAVAALVFLAAIFQKTSFLDIAMLYAMLIYVTTLAFVKYLEQRDLGE
ncbi:cation:proton antiporter [bacterium]|nr:cation:proton antiporter [bacterium]